MTSEPAVDGTGKIIDAMNPVWARAFWGPRRNDVVQVAQQLVTCMNRLVQINSADRWMLRGADKNELLAEPYEDEHPVQRWLQGRIMTDDDRPPKPILEWGYSIDTRIMRGERTVLTSNANAGDYDSLGNSFPLKGPEWLAGNPSALASARVTALAESWSPNWAAWHTYSEVTSQHAEPNTIEFGPVTYIAGVEPGELSAHIPSTARAAALHVGTLITLGNGPQDYRYEDTYLVRDAVHEIRGTLAYR